MGMWRHKKSKHTTTEDNKIKKYKPENNECKYCGKILAERKSRWRHENKTCKEKNNYELNSDNNISLKLQILNNNIELLNKKVIENEKNILNNKSKDNIKRKNEHKIKVKSMKKKINKSITDATEDIVVDTIKEIADNVNMEIKDTDQTTNQYIIQQKNEIKKYSHSYIYLIEKYDVNENETIYKFGKSNRPIYKRLKDHGTEAKVLLVIDVDDCDICEKKILHVLREDKQIISKKDIGNEYFSCKNKRYIKQLIVSQSLLNLGFNIF